MADNNLNETPRRALALDALRGFAIITMCLSGVVPWEGLPSWMYHAQSPRIPEEAIRHIPTHAGFTWVDLVFPMFLFAMGAAFPFALSSRIAKRVPIWKIALGIISRGLILVGFAIYVDHITPGRITSWPLYLEQWFTGMGYEDPVNISKMFLGLLGFLLMFPVFVRFPKDWPAKTILTVRSLGILVALAFLLSINAHVFEKVAADGLEGFAAIKTALHQIVKKSNIILLVLANLSVWGSFVWLLSRRSWALRSAFLLIGVVAHMLHAGIAPEFLKNLTWSPASWMYNFTFAKYLLIVIPGTMIGDMMLLWMKQSDGASVSGWSRNRVLGLLGFLVLFVVFVHIGLQARWGLAVLAFSTILGLVGWFLFATPSNSTEKLVVDFYRLSLVWLLIGLVAELLEMYVEMNGKVVGGIKKDPSTMAYYLVSTGLSIQLLAAFFLMIEMLQWRKANWLFISNGQNPMLAYVGIRNLLAPVVVIIPLDWFFFTKVFTNPWPRYIWSLAKTIGLATVVGYLTKRKIFWRS